MKRGGTWTWFAALVLAILLFGVVGPWHSPWSGVPLSSRATVIFLTLLIVAIFTALFPPRRPARIVWAAAILAAVVAKLILAHALVTAGWKGTYWTAFRVRPDQYVPITGWFQNQGVAADDYRIDRQIAFDINTFGLSFINEAPDSLQDLTSHDRQRIHPLVVRWTGHAFAVQPHALTATVSANGHVTVELDGRGIFDAWNPAGAAVRASLAAGPHRIAVRYAKPAGVYPPAVVFATEEPVTIDAADPVRVARGARAERGIAIVSLIALLLLAAAFVDAYRPFEMSFFDPFWERPDKLAALVVAAVFIARGAITTIPERRTTIQMNVGDDPLVYERDARYIARNGPLLLNDQGVGNPYFFYPLYSYGRALSIIIFGDDTITLQLFNQLCIAAAVLLMWMLLRNYLSRGALAALLLLVLAPFCLTYLGRYATQALSDNLFVPCVIAMLVATVVSLERRSIGWAFFAGVLTAIGAAARASLMTHLAFGGLLYLLYSDFGSFARRLRAGIVFGAGFAIGLAPFTLRNWIVSKKFVLLVASIVEMPWFLFQPGDKVPPLDYNGHMPNFVESLYVFARVYRSNPLHYTGSEVRKVLFTLGFVDVGPNALPVQTKLLVLLTLAFLIAVRVRRIDRRVLAALLAFCASHMLAMVMAAPYTYGYKIILPFMLAMMAGGAFLLRQNGKRALLPELPPVPAERSIEEVVAGDAAAVRRGLARATGDLVLVVPDALQPRPADVRRLAAYAGDFDVIFGGRPFEPPNAARGTSWLLAKWVAAWWRSEEPLTDAGCGLWMVRRDAIPHLLERLTDSGGAVAAEVMVVALESGLRVVQVEIGTSAAAAPRSLSWVRPAVRAIIAHARERASLVTTRADATDA